MNVTTSKGKETAAVKRYEVADGIAMVPIVGDLIHRESTETDNRPRWTELTLYRLATDEQEKDYERREKTAARDGVSLDKDDERAAGDYLIHSLGRSLVYHKGTDGCRKGSRTKAGNLPDEVWACEECWPDNDPVLDDDTDVRVETDRGFAARASTPRDVVTALEEMTAKTRNRNSGMTMRRMSGPAQDLIRMAAEKDDGIAAMIGMPASLPSI